MTEEKRTGSGAAGDNAGAAQNPLTETIDRVRDEADGAKVYFEDVLVSLNHRGFGPLMMAPALLVLLPTGALPGVPAISGACLCLISIQVLAGRHYPWIPRRIGKASIGRKKLFSMIERMRPVLKFIDRFIDARLVFLSGGLVDRVIALLCLLLGAAMIVAGFIPFLPALLALPVLLFALGTTARDGVMILCGFSFTAAAALFIFWMSGSMGGEDRLHIGSPVFISSQGYKTDLNLLGGS